MPQRKNQGDAGWWAKMPGGGERRLWVARQGRSYACRVEITGVEVREHVTERREEALAFLGNDDLAQSALSACESGPGPPEG